jgi:hypothetical protein
MRVSSGGGGGDVCGCGVALGSVGACVGSADGVTAVPWGDSVMEGAGVSAFLSMMPSEQAVIERKASRHTTILFISFSLFFVMVTQFGYLKFTIQLL